MKTLKSPHSFRRMREKNRQRIREEKRKEEDMTERERESESIEECIDMVRVKERIQR